MNTARKHIFAAFAVLASAALAAEAHAQAQASQTTSSTATIFQPIQLAKNSDLSFGNIVRPISGNGTVTIDPANGARSASGPLAIINTGPNATPGRASYTVTGEGGQNFSITVPASFNMTRQGSADTIQVTLSSTAGAGTLSGVLGTTGTSTFGVGGTIPVTNGTASGAYAGTFVVTVAYN
ncbi:DUF4402 domain-containing protein [Phenylobacterium deserti]|uniref:DUF4402 domain-containing protein n=1 Tax=Phenylobacterium deserti TaxID=1914756 RepID=A0A328AP92_9CAUL|nr:DUF4402 domain-containing protein [Phenylobacterium deserti]RAK56813.1 hypothetical protein DJ018_02230 [Phenylobacterium deserti]